MDRFSWSSSILSIFPGENGVHQQSGVRIYDGENRVSYESNASECELILCTTFQIKRDCQCDCLSTILSSVNSFECSDI